METKFTDECHVEIDGLGRALLHVNGKPVKYKYGKYDIALNKMHLGIFALALLGPRATDIKSFHANLSEMLPRNPSALYVRNSIAQLRRALEPHGLTISKLHTGDRKKSETYRVKNLTPLKRALKATPQRFDLQCQMVTDKYYRPHLFINGRLVNLSQRYGGTQLSAVHLGLFAVAMMDPTPMDNDQLIARINRIDNLKSVKISTASVKVYLSQLNTGLQPHGLAITRSRTNHAIPRYRYGLVNVPKL